MLRGSYFNLILPMRKLGQNVICPQAPVTGNFQSLVSQTTPSHSLLPHCLRDLTMTKIMKRWLRKPQCSDSPPNALNSSKKVLLLRPLSRKEHRLLNSTGVTGSESGEITNCFVWKGSGSFQGAIGPTIIQPSTGSSDQLWGLEITTVLPSQPVPDLAPSHPRNYLGLITLPLPLLC